MHLLLFFYQEYLYLLRRLQKIKNILEFMKKVKIEFATKWNVITYPSTFGIDKSGKIKYGVNVTIEWDYPEFIKKIQSLL